MARKPFNPALIKGPPEPAAPARTGLISVSQLTAMVKEALAAGLPSTLHVVGEISNFKRHSSGHLYFTLKDRASELSCIMWRSTAAALKFKPADGMEVIATGGVEVFERAGRYQLYIRKLEPRGVGALELAFRQLCEKLSGEGLFDAARKRPLPLHPTRIVLVTSPTGAAVMDMIRTIRRRFPPVAVLVYPVPVQGEGAAGRIAGAIRRVNAQADRLGGVDLMIVGRGGGSLEDLWAFNEEVVARAIFDSGIPVVSAVGHEVDVTIADLVADVRAATPTAAAELAVPVLTDVLDELLSARMRLSRAARGRMELLRARFAAAVRHAVFREPGAIVRRRAQVVDELSNRMHRSIYERIRRARGRLVAVEPVIQRIAPHRHLLRRGLQLRDLVHRLRWAATDRLAQAGRTVDRQAGRLSRVSPEAAMSRSAERLERLEAALKATMQHRLTLERERLRRRQQHLAAMGYESVLRRGFSITRTAKGRRVVRSVKDVKDHEPLITQVADGTFESQVVNLKQLELFE